jgi:hypothetical protein
MSRAAPACSRSRTGRLSSTSRSAWSGTTRWGSAVYCTVQHHPEHALLASVTLLSHMLFTALRSSQRPGMPVSSSAALWKDLCTGKSIVACTVYYLGLLDTQDFHELLPVPLMTHTTWGPLNLAAMLPSWALPTDLGPKTYVAYGQVGTHQHGGLLDLTAVPRNQHAGIQPEFCPGSCMLELGCRAACNTQTRPGHKHKDEVSGMSMLIHESLFAAGHTR